MINMDAEKEKPARAATQAGLFEATGNETSEVSMHENDELIENTFIRRVGELVANAGGADKDVLDRTLRTVRRRLFTTLLMPPYVHSGVAMFPGSIGLLAIYLGKIEDGRCVMGFVPVDGVALAKARDPGFLEDVDIECASDGLLLELEEMGETTEVRSPGAVLLAARLINAICPVSGAALAARDDFASAAIWVVGRQSEHGRRAASGFARLERRVSEAVYRAVHGAAEAA